MDDNDPTEDARNTLADFNGRWKTFCKEFGTAAQAPLNNAFAYAENVLTVGSTPTSWIKNGFALWIQSYGTAQTLCKATYNLWFPPENPS